MALKRIKKEFEDIKSEKIENIIELVPINENDLFHWNAIILGPYDTPYEGGKFHLNITFPSDYPFNPPKCLLKTNIFHSQISNCYLYLPILINQWSPLLTIGKVLSHIISLLYLYYDECDCLNPEAQFLYKSNKYEFYKKARKWAVKYADAPKNGKVRINFELNFIKYDENFKLIKLNDFYKCKAIIKTPEDSPYKGDEIELFFDFSEDYPLKPPSFSFSILKTDKYLDFVEKMVNIILKENWNKNFNINDILKLISNCLQYNFINNIENLKFELKEKKLSDDLIDGKKLEKQDIENNFKESEELIQSIKVEDQILKEKINKLKEIIKNINLEYKNAYKNIIEKDNEIKMLRDELSKFPFKLSEGEKLMTIIISSFDKAIQYAFVCKNTDLFKNIEEKFYEKFPEYLETANFFTKNGQVINRNKSLENNNIKDNDILILKTFN